MSFRTGLTLLLFALAPLVGSAIERVETKSFPVQPGCTLKIDTYRGGISIEEGDQPEIVVRVTMELGADTEAEADRLREALQFELKSENNTVSIFARNPRETRLRFVWHDRYQIDLAYRITVPHQCNVDLTTLNGGITVGSIEGRQLARTDTGNIFFKRIDGSVEARTNFGDAIVSRCSGPVKIRVLNGIVRLGTIGGPIDVKDESGEVEILGARAAATVYAANGEVSIGFSKEYAGESKIETAAGTIYAKLAPTLNCTVEASSFWGHVESKLPLAVTTGALGKKKLTARVNAGGPTISLHANGGHVKISALDTEFE